NGTIHFSGAAVSPDASLCVCSCGRPDEQLMFSESVRVWRSPFAFPDDVHAALLRLSKEEARVESSRQYRMAEDRQQAKGRQRQRRRATLAEKRERRELARKQEQARQEAYRYRMARVAEERDQMARLREQELAAFRKHQPIVEAYIEAKRQESLFANCVYCHERRFVTFERHGHIFPWPCACIGGRDPSCVANWKQGQLVANPT